jgi:uncharacterized membrane protein YagU involved in acid resistance
MTLTSGLLPSFTATVVFTAIEAGSQEARLTRMSLPYLLGTIFTPAREKAKLVGFLVHLLNGQIFALIYLALFDRIGASVWHGLVFGCCHALVVLLVILPLMPGLHPRMASEHSGPVASKRLEPPGPFGLNYGFATPAFVLFGHAVFGILLAYLYRS